MSNRIAVSDTSLDLAANEIRNMLRYRLETKGDLSYASSHEILGIIAEEYHELVEAVQSNDIHEVEAELLDIAVGCWFALASIREERNAS